MLIIMQLFQIFLIFNNPNRAKINLSNAFLINFCHAFSLEFPLSVSNDFQSFVYELSFLCKAPFSIHFSTCFSLILLRVSIFIQKSKKCFELFFVLWTYLRLDSYRYDLHSSLHIIVALFDTKAYIIWRRVSLFLSLNEKNKLCYLTPFFRKSKTTTMIHDITQDYNFCESRIHWFLLSIHCIQAVLLIQNMTCNSFPKKKHI